jgi:PPOX class probable F420-dependent enzyme
MTPDQDTFLREHTYGVLATGRRDGSPQQSMVAYVVDEDGRIVISAKSYTAKWKNALRQRRVSFAVPDGRAHLVIYGEVEAIAADPERAELTADVFARLSDGPRPDPSTIRDLLDEQQRTVLRITPTKADLHE